MRLFAAIYSTIGTVFQFTHPVRGATNRTGQIEYDVYVSIHAPRAGCDTDLDKRSFTTDQFQFTHPVRGATTAQRVNEIIKSFNSRTPCGVRLECRPLLINSVVVSIHAPRAGCDISKLDLTS